MTVSAITGITQEGQPQELSSFLRSGVVYVLWHTPISLGLRRLSWKPHNGLNFTEVVPDLGQAFRGVAALYDPGTDHVVVVWDDGAYADGSNSGTLSVARFNPTSGELISGPTQLFPGSNPKLSYRSTTQNSEFLLYYRTAKNLGVYGRVSADGGLTWESGYPIWTGQVSGTSALDVVAYNNNHASIAQLGTETKRLLERGLFRRTRPLVSIVKHPTIADQYFIGEPSKFDNTTLTDNLRGALVLSTDNTKLYNLDGVQQGTSDTLGAVTKLSLTDGVLTPSTSGLTVDGNTRLLWRLDEVSGSSTAADATGTYPLPLVGGTVIAEAGQIGRGRHFYDSTLSGASDAATANKFARTSGSWTFGFWIKVPSVDPGSTTRGVLTLCDNYNINSAIFYIKTAFGALYAGSTSTGNYATGISLTSNQWTHCVIAWSSGSVMKVWKNGVALADYAAATPGPAMTTPTWLLGRAQSTTFAGQEMVLDDIWMDNTLWTTAQVQELYATGVGGIGPTGNGDDLREYSLTPTLGTLNVDLPGTSYAVDTAVSSTHAYVAEYADNSTTAGQFVVVNLTTGSTGTVLSGLNGVRAVAVANFLTPPRIFVATTESGVERLRVYEQNALTPTLLLNTKLTSRANALSVAPDPSNPTGALVYASLTDRLNIYKYVSSSAPVQLTDTLTLPGGGSFFRSQVASNGNIFVAAGNAGLLCLDANGKILAQTSLSGEVISEWTRATVYSAGALVRPREGHQFAKSRYYFRTTAGGTSGNSEPSWTNSGTVTDNTVSWTPVGLVDGVAVGVALDETNKQVLVAGSAGGNLGTDGRVWLVTAAGLL